MWKMRLSDGSSLLTVWSVPEDFWPFVRLQPEQLDVCRLAASFQRDAVATTRRDYQTDGSRRPLGLFNSHFRELKFPQGWSWSLTHPWLRTVHNNPLSLPAATSEARAESLDASPEQFFPLARIKCTYEDVYQCYITAAESPSFKTHSSFCWFCCFYRLLDAGWLMFMFRVFAVCRGFFYSFFLFVFSRLNGVSVQVYLVSH